MTRYSPFGTAQNEKRRREGFSQSSLTPVPNTTTDDITPNGAAPVNVIPNTTRPVDATSNNTTHNNPANITPHDPANTTPDDLDDTTFDDMNSDNIPPNDTGPGNTTPDNLTLVTPEESTPVTSNEEDPVITPSPAAQEGAIPLARSVLSPIPIATSTTPAHPFEHDQSYPVFITPAVVAYLDSVDGGLRWLEMVKNYLTLEGQYHSRVSRYSLS